VFSWHFDHFVFDLQLFDCWRLENSAGTRRPARQRLEFQPDLIVISNDLIHVLEHSRAKTRVVIVNRQRVQFDRAFNAFVGMGLFQISQILGPEAQPHHFAVASAKASRISGFLRSLYS
jgi:hypothetical protein